MEYDGGNDDLFIFKNKGGRTAFIGGNVGIGTTEPSEVLEVRASTYEGSHNIGFRCNGRYGTRVGYTDELNGHHYWHVDTKHDGSWTNNRLVVHAKSGNVGIGTADPNFKLDVRGKIACNTIKYHSDRRWKKNIETIENALEKVKNLRGVSFKWRIDEYKEMNFTKGKHLGLIAQEVEEVVPEVVHTDSKGYKSTEYANLVPLLIEAIKTQQSQIEDLQAQLANLKSLLSN
jgi:hypothetical protein